MLFTKNRIRLNIAPQAYIDELFAGDDVTAVPVMPDIATNAAFLPEEFPADPADRIIAATALAYRAYLVTHDRAILRYAKASGELQCIPVLIAARVQ